MDTSNIAVGSRLNHPLHGAGTVTFVGTHYLGIAFDEGGEALMRRDVLEGESVAESQSAEPPRASLPWPASTFVPESGNPQHFLGSHWQAFVDDAKDILVRLPEMLRQAISQFGYGAVESHARRARRLPDDWPRGVQLVWPVRTEGVSVILHLAQDANRAVSIFPFTTSGVQATLILREVGVWESGLEAQIWAGWGKSLIAFFDSEYLINRAHYEAGRSYDFILAGVAYSARPAVTMEWQVDRHPDEIAWLNRNLKPGELLHEASMTVSTDGAAMLLPVEELDIDDYSFRAPVKSVEPFRREWLGQDGWRVRATIMRFGSEDADLDVFITRRAWEGDAPPKVGQDIEGKLWLQGHLWQPR